MQRKTKVTTLFNNSSPPCHRSAILENIHWTQTVDAVLCKLHHTDTFPMFIYTLIWTKTAYPRGANDIEQHTLLDSLLSKMALQWRGGNELLNEVIIFVFFAYEKYSSSFVKLQLNPDLTWTILPVFLLRFWTLIVLIPLLSMEGLRALRIHQKFLYRKKILLCVQRWTYRSYGFGTIRGCI